MNRLPLFSRGILEKIDNLIIMDLIVLVMLVILLRDYLKIFDYGLAFGFSLKYKLSASFWDKIPVKGIIKDFSSRQSRKSVRVNCSP